MLRILLGYRGHATDESPAVLYAGHDGDAAQAAADAAPEEFVRLKRVDGPEERNARRNRAPEIRLSAMPKETPSPAAVAGGGDLPGAEEVGGQKSEVSAASTPATGKKKREASTTPDLSGED